MEKETKLKVIKKAVTSAEAKNIWNKLWIKKDNVNPKEFTMWMNVEREHGSLVSPETNITKDKPLMTGKIAWAHLKEMKNYYTKLDKMENKK